MEMEGQSMKVRIPKSWGTLPSKQKDAICEYAR